MVEDFWRPRKATVVATQPGGVKVRIHQNNGVTNWVPAVASVTPVGTVGALVRYSREDALFVPSDLAVSFDGHTHDDRYYTEAEVNALLAARQPRALAGGAFVETTYTTAGDRVFTAAQVEFTGLTVGGGYNVSYTATFVASGTSGNASFGVQSTSNGSSSLPFTFGYGIPVTTKREHIAGYSTTRTVGGDGKITVAPVFRWNSGSVFIEAVYLTVTVTMM